MRLTLKPTPNARSRPSFRGIRQALAASGLALGLAAPGAATAQDVCICLYCAGPQFDRYVLTDVSMMPTLAPGQCFIVDTLASFVGGGRDRL